MRPLLVCAVLALCAGWASADDKAKSFASTFAKAQADRLPADYRAAQTGEGKGSEWKVVPDATAKSGYALAQTAEGPGPLFNLCVVSGPKLADVKLSVKVKAVGGKIDQGGGLVWRYEDANNYYVCRYNPLESNFRLYKVVAGKRTQLASKGGLKVPEGRWFTVSVAHKGDAIECSLDGTKQLEAKDATFASAGRFGLWSKADARSHFDELRAEGE